MARYIHAKSDDSGQASNPVDYLGLWAQVASYTPSDARQTLLVDKSYYQLEKLGQYRALRPGYVPVASFDVRIFL